MRLGTQNFSPDNICEACGRTLIEIASWQQLSNDEKWHITKILPTRLGNSAEQPWAATPIKKR